MHAFSRRSAAVLSATTILLAACGDSTGSSATGNLRFNLATRPSALAASAAAISADVAPLELTDGTNTLTIDGAQLVIRKLELQRVGADVTCDDDDREDEAGDDRGTDQVADAADDDCPELRLGPVLVDLPLSPNVATLLTAPIGTGEYDRVQFQLHKPSGSNDAAFLQAHPELDGASVRVTGKYNGVAFTFTSDVTAEQHADLAPPLVVTESGANELTLHVDVNSWFRTSGGALVSPATGLKGGPNESVVKGNIQRAFRAFEDHDRDGEDD